MRYNHPLMTPSYPEMIKKSEEKKYKVLSFKLDIALQGNAGNDGPPGRSGAPGVKVSNSTYV